MKSVLCQYLIIAILFAQDTKTAREQVIIIVTGCRLYSGGILQSRESVWTQTISLKLQSNMTMVSHFYLILSPLHNLNNTTAMYAHFVIDGK